MVLGGLEGEAAALLLDPPAGLRAGGCSLINCIRPLNLRLPAGRPTCLRGDLLACGATNLPAGRAGAGQMHAGRMHWSKSGRVHPPLKYWSKSLAKRWPNSGWAAVDPPAGRRDRRIFTHQLYSPTNYIHPPTFRATCWIRLRACGAGRQCWSKAGQKLAKRWLGGLEAAGSLLLYPPAGRRGGRMLVEYTLAKRTGQNPTPVFDQDVTGI